MKVHTLQNDRPIIGLTGPSSFTTDCLSMIESFFDANPLLLYQTDHENLKTWLNICDAVILAGGVDIHPRTYRESIPVGKSMRQFDCRRDVREMQVIDFCLLRGIPILGICRGHQLLGIDRLGLELEKDLSSDSTVIHSASRQDGKLEFDIHTPLHTVNIQDSSNYPGDSLLFVNSFHHQGLIFDKNKVKDLEVVGLSDFDGKKSIIELMVCKSENWMSCQWHPEWDWTVQDASRNFLNYFKRHFLHQEAIKSSVA